MTTARAPSARAPAEQRERRRRNRRDDDSRREREGGFDRFDLFDLAPSLWRASFPSTAAITAVHPTAASPRLVRSAAARTPTTDRAPDGTSSRNAVRASLSCLSAAQTNGERRDALLLPADRCCLCAPPRAAHRRGRMYSIPALLEPDAGALFRAYIPVAPGAALRRADDEFAAVPESVSARARSSCRRVAVRGRRAVVVSGRRA